MIGVSVAAAEEAPHWPRAGADVTIPILVYNYDPEWRADSYSRVADAASQWSASSVVNLVVVGEIPNPDEVCVLQDGAYAKGYISVCMGVPTANGSAASVFRDCPPLDDGECWSNHLRAGKTVHFTPLPKTHHIVHEIGHTLGLYHESGGVMTADGTVTTISAGNFADLEAIMAHDDGYETVATFTEPTPTPTPTATPTVTPTPTTTPTVTPPPCSPPRAKRCR